MGPIALLSHDCQSPLVLCEPKNTVECLLSPLAKWHFIECELGKVGHVKWDLKKGEEITVWYGEEGVENFLCGACVWDVR